MNRSLLVDCSISQTASHGQTNQAFVEHKKQLQKKVLKKEPGDKGKTPPAMGNTMNNQLIPAGFGHLLPKGAHPQPRCGFQLRPRGMPRDLPVEGRLRELLPALQRGSAKRGRRSEPAVLVVAVGIAVGVASVGCGDGGWCWG